jgi:hypothetical protein
MVQTVNVIIPSEDRERLLAIANAHSHRRNIFSVRGSFSFRRNVCRSGSGAPGRRQPTGGVTLVGLLCDKTRKPGRAPLSAEVGADVLLTA